VAFDPGAALEGRVLTLEGEPLRYATLWAGVQAAESDEEGRYRLAGFEDGDVSVEVTHAHAEPATVTARVHRTRPTSLDVRVRAAGFLVLAAPREAVVQRRVELRVKDDRGLGAGSCSLAPEDIVPPEDGEAQMVLQTFPGLPPGRYVVEARWDGKDLPPVEVQVVRLETATVRLQPR
jgi:hypothetical protein